MNSEFYVEIPRSKGEYPALVVAAILCFAGWAFHYGFFSWTGGFVWLGVVLPLLAWFYIKRRGVYYVKANEHGIEWRQGLISRMMYIPWNYMQRVDYLEFEINFKIKETGQVVSFATSGISDEKAVELKEYISDVIGKKMAAGEL